MKAHKAKTVMFILKETVSVISSDLLHARWQWPIYNGTQLTCLSGKIWIRFYQICMCLFIKTDYFHLWILCQNYLPISSLQKMMLSSTFLIRLRFQGRSCINRALLSFHGGSFKITCTIPLICLMKIKLVFSSLTHSKKFQIFI